MRDLIAHVSIAIEAPPSAVWAALTDDESLGRAMHGISVTSSWEEGGEVALSSLRDGAEYERRGRVVAVEQGKELAYTVDDERVSMTIEPAEGGTKLRAQVSRATGEAGDGSSAAGGGDEDRDGDDPQAAEREWSAVLQNLKKVVEGSAKPA